MGDYTDIAQAISAVAIVGLTGAYVWITRSLLEATKRSADAAKLSAETGQRALDTYERPYVIPGQIDRIRTGGDATVSRPDLRYVSCSIGNYGRTPAIVHYVVGSFGPIADKQFSDPDSPVKKKPKDYNTATILAAGEVAGVPHVEVLPGVVIFDDNDQPHIEGHDDLFLVINIKFEDIVGIIRIARYVWKYDRVYRRFLRHGSSETVVETAV